MKEVREALEHQEVHFLAEDEKVAILPTFTLTQVHLLGGTVRPERFSLCPLSLRCQHSIQYPAHTCNDTGITSSFLSFLYALQFGPFRPQIQVTVPFWLALILKKQGRCLIVPPRWLQISSLDSLVSLERTDDIFQTLPFHYVEIATDLCKYARDDLPEWDHLFDLVETVRSVRHNKMQAGLRSLDARATKGVKLSNITLLEVNIMRAFMTNSLEFYRWSSPHRYATDTPT
mmetsp:Transcript_13499/g.53055  ORF Transcript_13499/g.53055 Transcript_13499/m.53055 type:complete len:231 (+) Transcript_13499:182-874(+)